MVVQFFYIVLNVLSSDCPSSCTECTYSSTAGDTVCNVEKCSDGNAQNPTAMTCHCKYTLSIEIGLYSSDIDWYQDNE